MATTITIADLHKLAYTRFPKADVHQILHDAAAMLYHRCSLSECNAEQLDGLRRFVMDHPARNAESRNAESRNGESRNRERTSPPSQGGARGGSSTHHSSLSTHHCGSEPHYGRHCDRPRCTTRPRSGTPIPAGVVRLASAAQRGLIRRLFSELSWSQSTANSWLLRFHGVDTIDQIATVQDASRIIQHLMRIKADKRTTAMR